ncbi:hypothetical protein QL852_002818 [Enterococcus faecalis]|uniref:hypothetical protein n=1 Tax=Enterococcus faecalis TaxID=1351 RepID=UPI000330248E|nr:hypothetical protein [Enterococcus faecalis]MDT6294690.1 hypothetical protein [Enterococcus faecium]EGO8634331.1 hypothetical protein [Enterococcus faecalis]EHG5971826.1 hypothetical protein [Enterococcus faecalis]EKZ0408960.1 hypothetical protein [Enterococcus faecalis]EOE00182.1 hypothetical protein Q9I_00004 [Enterococcus faecalis EnGen0074]
MKKSLTLLIVGLTIIGSGLFIGSSLFSKNETTEQTLTSTTKEISPELFLETEVLDTKKSETISSVNELYQGDISFEHANPEKTYLLSIQLLDKKNHEYVGPDKKPLKREKELVLGKSKGVVHVIVKANSPMLTHIQHLKDVQVSVSLKERE